MTNYLLSPDTSWWVLTLAFLIVVVLPGAVIGTALIWDRLTYRPPPYDKWEDWGDQPGPR